MFTGIIEETGKIQSLSLAGTSGVLRVRAKKVLEGTRIGDSIAVNGVCLTVTSLSPDAFTADVMAETVRRTGLGSLKPGDRVNLERAMAADGRFGGHIVAGHIDGTGRIESLIREENAVWVTVHPGRFSAISWRREVSPSTASASRWPMWTSRSSKYPSSPTPARRRRCCRRIPATS